MAAPFKNDSSNVSDSTDWIGTPLAVLEHVDSALRCQVCKDFYKTPMTTSCLHTFCSICIHRCLASDGQCPACRTKDQASKLKSNWVLEQVVDAFKHARPVALGYAIPSPIIDKRKIKETDFSTGDTEIPRKRTRSSNRTAKNLQELGAAVVQNDEARDDEDYVPEDGLVSCPVCQTRIKADRLNSHLDLCLEQPSTNPQLALQQRSISKPPNLLQRLPNINYSLMKDGALKKKLSELGISAAGSRPLQERRHTEWVIIWNANCDAANPRRKGELLQDLETWERAQGGGRLAAAASAPAGKEFDRAEWAAKNVDSFQSLIASARKNIGRKISVVLQDPVNQAGSNAGSASSLEELPKLQRNNESTGFNFDATINAAMNHDAHMETPSDSTHMNIPNSSSHLSSRSSQNARLEERHREGVDVDIINKR